MGPITPEQYPEDCCNPRRLPSHRGGEKGREKLLQEFLVQVLQASLAEGPVNRLISAVAAPGTQLIQRAALPDKPVNSETPGVSA